MADETEAVSGARESDTPAGVVGAAEIRRRQVDGARFALVVLCGVRALTSGIGLLRASANNSIDQWWGFQGWATAILLVVLYAVAAAGYSDAARWPGVASVAADVLTILVVIDFVSASGLGYSFLDRVEPDSTLLSTMQLVAVPTVSLVLALMAGRRRAPDAR